MAIYVKEFSKVVKLEESVKYYGWVASPKTFTVTPGVRLFIGYDFLFIISTLSSGDSNVIQIHNSGAVKVSTSTNKITFKTTDSGNMAFLVIG